MAAGKYLFGTKSIIAKIVNMKLLIRVGGGFMSADEFIEQYGRIEMIKMMKSQNPNFDAEKANRKTAGRGSIGMARASAIMGSPMGIGDMKAKMRESMANVVTYGDTGSPSRLKNGGGSLASLEG